MSPIEFLRQRHSTPSRLLGEPGPTPEQLDLLIEVALRVPDHGRLEPWRLLLVDAAAGTLLGERLAALHQQQDPQVDPAQLDKDRGRFNRAPLVIVVIAKLEPGQRIPEQERLLSAGAVCMQLLLGAQALGFGAQWLTGWPAYDAGAGALLGLAEHERVVGFLHIGTPRQAPPPRPRPDPAAHVAHWKP